MTDVKTAGRYQLQEELGRGAMGIVYKAHDPTIGRTVAVKTMRLTEAGTGMTHDELIARFQIETRAAGLLTHPNIVVVYDAGEDGGIFYITMEYVQGRSLQALIDLKQMFPLPRVTRLMEQAGAALDFAHQNNVVHRDIKPANLMLTGDDVVKVSDFGTAKILQKGATQTGAILGTPSYMSPEQVKGKPVDGRSDIFSLGVILYELVTSEKPFPGQNVTTVIYKIVNEEPIPPRELDTSIHPGLNYVITKALSKDPDFRYQSGKDLIEDLRNYRMLGEGGSPMDSATVVMPGRDRPKVVQEAIARSKAQSAAAHPPPDTMAVPEPRPAPKPPTLPPLAGSLLRPAEPEKKSSGGLWIGVFLALVVVAGGYFLWPALQETFFKKPDTAVTQPVDSQPPAAQPTGGGDSKPAAKAPAESAAAAPTAPATKAPEPEPAALEPSSARLKSQFEQGIQSEGLRDKIRVQVAKNGVTLTGTLTPEEHRRLMQRIRRVAPRMRLNDRIQISRTMAAAPTSKAAPAASREEAGERPRTSPGMGEVEVITEAGATATLTGPKGNTENCKTPCRFEDLPPGRYTLNVTKEGYRPENRILNVRAGNINVMQIALEGLASELNVSGRPTGAEVYINNARHPEKAPTTLHLPPGSYSISIRKAGFVAYNETLQLKGDEMRKITYDLPAGEGGSQASAPAAPQPANARGSIDVRSIPLGADILIDGTNSGRKTPARIELPAGKKYRITIFMPGYAPVHKEVEVQGGLTISIRETLARPQ